MTSFRVDTKLFQELGELLVAKESTALVELIKNAYDADATMVTVCASNLGSPEKGRIVVSDNGIGMTEDEFQRGFLTIAGRTKNEGDRRSPVYGRRYTGEKGVGRLASHKLGRRLRLRSLKAGPSVGEAQSLGPAVSRLGSSIDWDAIERLETIDQIEGSGAVRSSIRQIDPNLISRTSGTLLLIGPLRKAWTARTKDAFLSEAATLAPLPVTWKPLPPGLAVEPLLFKEVPVRDNREGDPGFEVVFGGELSLGDQILPDVANAASWIAELAYDRDTGDLAIAVTPTSTLRRKVPTAEGFRFVKNVGKQAGPTFRGRILQRSNRVWDQAISGIRVFMEGFRVPPYGDRRDDWLGLERDYLSRTRRRLVNLEGLEVESLPAGNANEELVLQGNHAYLGAIFLHRATSTGLEMLVNREGFLQGSELDFLIKWTRIATDLIVRLKEATAAPVREVKTEERERQRAIARQADVNETPTAVRVRESAVALETGLRSVQKALEAEDYSGAIAKAAQLQPSASDIRSVAEQYGSDAVQWRVLASLGSELAAFVHEINAVGLQIGALAKGLEGALTIPTLEATRTAIRKARQQALDLADRIRRNATYLVDATSFEGRRRRSRMPLRPRFDATVQFFATRLAEKGITLENRIPEDLRTPPMFPSELAGIFTNLLSNAVKFTEDGGRILVDASIEVDEMVVSVANTGSAVDLGSSSRLFDAFRSTTENPDAVLGQGMGLGLTITRAFVEEYGGHIAFSKPPAGFATQIRFAIPTR